MKHGRVTVAVELAALPNPDGKLIVKATALLGLQLIPATDIRREHTRVARGRDLSPSLLHGQQ